MCLSSFIDSGDVEDLDQVYKGTRERLANLRERIAADC